MGFNHSNTYPTVISESCAVATQLSPIWLFQIRNRQMQLSTVAFADFVNRNLLLLSGCFYQFGNYIRFLPFVCSLSICLLLGFTNLNDCRCYMGLVWCFVTLRQMQHLNSCIWPHIQRSTIAFDYKCSGHRLHLLSLIMPCPRERSFWVIDQSNARGAVTRQGTHPRTISVCFK